MDGKEIMNTNLYFFSEYIFQAGCSFESSSKTLPPSGLMRSDHIWYEFKQVSLMFSHFYCAAFSLSVLPAHQLLILQIFS